MNTDEMTALVISDEPICQKQYHDKRKDVTWENCTLRAWLNGEYYDKTFSDAEKGAIIECKIHTPDNTVWTTKGGNDNRDKIWLPSIGEAKKYMKRKSDRFTCNWWWLRTPGCFSYCAAYVLETGSIILPGYYVNDEEYMFIRLAFKINLKSEFFTSPDGVPEN